MEGDEAESKNRLLERFVKAYRAGDTLYKLGDPADKLHLVRGGVIQLTRPVGAKERCFATLTTGSLFGEEILSAASQRFRLHTARVLRDARVLSLDTQTFQGLMERHQDIATRTCAQLAARIKTADSVLENLWTHSESLRLVQSLWSQIEDTARDALDAPIRVPAVASQLASSTALTLPKLERGLAELSEQGLVELGPDFVNIPDPRAFLSWKSSLEKEEVTLAES